MSIGTAIAKSAAKSATTLALTAVQCSPAFVIARAAAYAAGYEITPMAYANGANGNGIATVGVLVRKVR